MDPRGRQHTEVAQPVLVGEVRLFHHGGHTLGETVLGDDVTHVGGDAFGQDSPLADPGVVGTAGVEPDGTAVGAPGAVHCGPVIDPATIANDRAIRRLGPDPGRTGRLRDPAL